jgi:hypothetical protein
VDSPVSRNDNSDMTNDIITTTTDCKEFSISIKKDRKNRVVVTKSEIVNGVPEPVYMTYAIDIDDAIKIQHYLIQEIHKFKLN